MKFDDIIKETDLIQYLDDSSERLKGRKYIYHYTRLDRCVDIFTSKHWYLSQANCMNDILEYKNGDMKRWENIFFASFMSDADESIGMWSMYSQPWKDGVQIAIPVKEAKQWVKEVPCIWEISCKDFKPTGARIDCNKDNKVFLSSVAYSSCDNPVDGEDRITWSTVSNTRIKKAAHNEILTGYIKDSAWEYEKEIRIKATFNNTMHFSKVAIDIPDYVLDSIVITAGPLFRGDLLKKLQAKIARRYNVDESLFTGRFELYGRCGTCKKKK